MAGANSGSSPYSPGNRCRFRRAIVPTRPPARFWLSHRRHRAMGDSYRTQMPRDGIAWHAERYRCGTCGSQPAWAAPCATLFPNSSRLRENRPAETAGQTAGPPAPIPVRGQCHLAKVDLGGGVSLRGVLPGGRQDHLAGRQWRGDRWRSADGSDLAWGAGRLGSARDAAPAEDKELLHRYAAWHLLRRLRQRNRGASTTYGQLDTVPSATGARRPGLARLAARARAHPAQLLPMPGWPARTPPAKPKRGTSSTG